MVISGTNDAVRADEAALPTLDAEVFFPDRNSFRDVALFKSGRAGRKGAVRRDQADGNLVAAPDQHHRCHALDEIGSVATTIGGLIFGLVAVAGTLISNKRANVASTAAKFFATTASPLRL